MEAGNAAHQNLSVSFGPIGKCDRFSPMLLVKRPKSESPPNADTPMVEGTVHLRPGHRSAFATLSY